MEKREILKAKTSFCWIKRTDVHYFSLNKWLHRKNWMLQDININRWKLTLSLWCALLLSRKKLKKENNYIFAKKESSFNSFRLKAVLYKIYWNSLLCILQLHFGLQLDYVIVFVLRRRKIEWILRCELKFLCLKILLQDNISITE